MRFTVARKIWLGFMVLIISVIITFTLTYTTVSEGQEANQESDKISEQITNVNSPSQYMVVQLKMAIVESKKLITTWALVESISEDPDKIKLNTLTNEEIPAIKDSLLALSQYWEPENDSIIHLVFENMDELFWLHEQIKMAITSIESYSDPTTFLIYRPMVLPEGEIDMMTNEILWHLDELIDNLDTSTTGALDKERASRAERSQGEIFLLNFLLSLLIALPVYGILVAFFTTRSIVKPVARLREVLLALGKGVFLDDRVKPGNDEIGEMTQAMNQLVDGLKRTTDFANEIGRSNFDYPYQPLSDEDTLGHALLKMRDELAESERILVQKVEERTAEVVRQKEELEDQKHKIEELYTDVTDSIRYAKRLQESILPSREMITRLMPESFVLYKPKDIVSGDFYWFEKSKNKVLFAAVDCTGHGVPGAFMSLVGSNGLNAAVKEHQLDQPAEILGDLHRQALATLNQDNKEGSMRDGMDMALCALDTEKMQLEYAGAYNPLYLVRNGEIIQTKADKFPIGGEDDSREFTNHTIQLEKGDSIYVFSDGFADQFGGEKGKKFMYSRFRELLIEIQPKNMDEQEKTLDETIENWKASYEQVDDILVIGVRV